MTVETGQRQRTLSSNGIAVAFDERLFTPMHDSTPWRGAPEQLRERFRSDGYVLLRGVLDPEQVLELRRDYFARFEPGMLARGSSATEGRFSGTEPADLPEYGTPGHPAHAFVRTAAFDTFTRDPRLHDIAETLFDAPVELLPRRILRHFHYGQSRASRAHVDFDYMDRGSDEVITAWVPLGDCPIECGGLVYLEGSHQIARNALDELRPYTDRPDDLRAVSNDLGRTARTLGGRWLWTNYQAGDVVLHSPHLVHASLDNDSEVMRLSADIRFRRRGVAPDERWNGTWSADDGF